MHGETHATPPPSLLISNPIDKGTGRNMAVESVEPPSSARDMDIDDADNTNDTDDAYGLPSSTDGSPSSGRRATSECWKDTTVDAAGNVYKEMDGLLRKFCALHSIPFTCAFKGYIKQHTSKISGENPWNTYVKLHSHPDHMARELARKGFTIAEFNVLDSDEQQKLRGKCWKEFQGSFN